MVDTIDISPPLGKSDHSLFSFVFNIYVENQNTTKIRYKYDKADFESMRNILNIDWRTILLNKDIDEQWTVFVSKINDAIDKCVPKVKINSNTDIKSDKNCPLTRKARAKIKKKQRLWNRQRTNPSDSIRKEYNIVRNQVRRISRKRVRLKEMNIAENVKHNPKKFWSYVQSKTKTRTSIPDLYIDSVLQYQVSTLTVIRKQ
jgi:hypothetical protein